LLVAYFQDHPDEFPDYVVKEFSSDLSPQQRHSLLDNFSQGKIHMFVFHVFSNWSTSDPHHFRLICSDIISRGIDVDCVQSVVNYNVPTHIKKYIHRVGRTARAGKVGTAFSLVEHKEVNHSASVCILFD
jgi:ATP-dependent RNA helicase DDX51/DBP6